MVQGLGFGVEGAGFKVEGAEFRVEGHTVSWLRRALARAPALGDMPAAPDGCLEVGGLVFLAFCGFWGLWLSGLGLKVWGCVDPLVHLPLGCPLGHLPLDSG